MENITQNKLAIQPSNTVDSLLDSLQYLDIDSIDLVEVEIDPTLRAMIHRC